MLVFRDVRPLYRAIPIKCTALLYFRSFNVLATNEHLADDITPILADLTGGESCALAEELSALRELLGEHHNLGARGMS